MKSTLLSGPVNSDDTEIAILQKWMSSRNHVININELASLAMALRWLCGDLDVCYIQLYRSHDLRVCYIHR